MHNRLDVKRKPTSTPGGSPKLSYSALLEVVKEKTDIVDRQNKTIQDLQVNYVQYSEPILNTAFDQFFERKD